MQGFVLHKRRFKETSLIVEFLTLERGRIATIVKGALRAKSKVGNSLQHSMRLELDVIGKSNLPTLTRVEVIEHFPNLRGLKAFTLLYVNELIIKCFGENDPIKDVYHNYAELQRTLGGAGDYQSALRYFELTIFEAMGVQPELNITADTMTSVSDSETYFFKPSIGILENNFEGDSLKVHGETLCLLSKKAELNGRAVKEAKLLAQAIVRHHLDGQELMVRRLIGK